ncbi:universal stress protein [Mycobacterium canetti]|uniref:universal stress protein n=1 Tax=Mycobacterium canetti TaxID=78331 RepID=UPI00034DCAB9|nr:universal stress protein [Mycobacterium canetti]
MSDPRPARAVVVGIDGSRAATHAALWAVDEAVNRDIPLRLVYVIDPSQPSAAGEGGGGQSAARAALHDASREVEATGQPVKIETEVLCGRPLTKLMQESRSAAMLCVGSVGLDHVRGRRGSVAATLAGSALCPVAVIHPSPAEPATTSQVSAVVAEVDNGVVLRHAFEEARLRGVPLRAVAVHAAETPDDVEQGSRLAHVHLSRRLAHWTRLYPEVRVDRAIAGGSACRHLAANAKPGQLFVADSHSAHELCGAYQPGCAVLTVRSANL